MQLTVHDNGLNPRDGILESEQPPRKKICLSTLGSRYEVGKSSTRGRGVDYGFTDTVEVEMRHRGIKEVRYGIMDTWIDPSEAVLEMVPTTLEKVNTRVTELAELHEHDTHDLYALLEDAQDGRTRISQRVAMDSQRVDLLMGDRMTLQETVWIVEEEAYAAREAWAQLVGLSQTVHHELQTLCEHVYAQEYQLQTHQAQLQLQSTLIQTYQLLHETHSQMQQTEMAGLQDTDRVRQSQIVETLRVMRDMIREMGDMQAELLALRGQLRIAGQLGGDARVPHHQDAPRDADRERLARCTAPAALPLPPLPPFSYPPPPVDPRDGILESEQPPHKKICLSTLGSRYEVGKSSTRGRGVDYGFTDTVEAEMRHRGIKEVGYGIMDTWIDPSEAVLEMVPTTLEKVNTRVTELAELHEHDTQDLYALLEDAQDGRTRISQRVAMDSQRVDLLMGDRMTLQETVWIVEEEAYAAREAWAQLVGLSQTVHHELQTLCEQVYAQEYQLQTHQAQLQLQSDMQAELLALHGQLRIAGQLGGDARVPHHQDAPRDADSHI
nr:hypothetical protein [Tanacetum cinerariifolium]